MKLALIADIHGNMFAFDAILEDIRRHNVDQLLCLGDVAAGGPQPHEVIQRLRELACPIVMGNTDAWLLEPVLKERANTFSKYTQDIEYWSAQQLNTEDKAFIKTFQPTIEWPLDNNKTLLAYHGTPRSFTERLLATTPDAQLDEIFADTTAQILVGAHTHIQLYRRYRDKIILNPGSVGMPMDRTWPFDAIRNTPWGEYAILSSDGNQLSIELLRVPFDIESFLAIHFQCGMPHAEWSTNLWNRV